MTAFSPQIAKHPLELLSDENSYTWSVPKVQPFDELLISWNAQRPRQGHYVLLASVWQRQWSPWLLYAVWGGDHQYSFHDEAELTPVRTFQDQLELLQGEMATGFRIRIEACQGARLTHFSTLFACTTALKAYKQRSSPPADILVDLPLPGLSQLCIDHPRSRSFCSPTSTTAVIRALLGSDQLHPAHFAKYVFDSAFDIYGNWPLNTAQAFVELGSRWESYCARLPNFDALLEILKRRLPVVVSVKGHLPGSLKPYVQGHLLVVRGYEGKTQRVLCMDPAYPTDEETTVAYPLNDFLAAWERRHHLAYLLLPLKN